MRIPFLGTSVIALISFCWLVPNEARAAGLACNPVEQYGIVGQTVHLQVVGGADGYRVKAPGGNQLIRGISSVSVQYANEGIFPITVWNDSGALSVCYVHVQIPPVGDGALESSVRSVVASSMPTTSGSGLYVLARITNFVDDAAVPLVSLIVSVSALLFVGYNGGAVFRRRCRLGNIDVVRPKQRQNIF